MWTRLTSACQVRGESFTAHKRALAAAGRGPGSRRRRVERDRTCGGCWPGTGLAGLDAAAHLGCSADAVSQRGGVIDAAAGLFPHLDVTIAYVLLFSVYSGIVPDGIDDLAGR